MRVESVVYYQYGNKEKEISLIVDLTDWKKDLYRKIQMTKSKSLHSTFYILHSNPGFTLMEMLISISVFVLFIGLVASSYISLVKANSTANDMQKLYRETRNVLILWRTKYETARLIIHALIRTRMFTA